MSAALRSAHVQADHVAAAERAVGSAGTPRAHRQQAHLSAVRRAVRRVAPFPSAAVRVARLMRDLNDSMRLCACREPPGKIELFHGSCMEFKSRMQVCCREPRGARRRPAPPIYPSNSPLEASAAQLAPSPACDRTGIRVPSVATRCLSHPGHSTRVPPQPNGPDSMHRAVPVPPLPAQAASLQSMRTPSKGFKCRRPVPECG